MPRPTRVGTTIRQILMRHTSAGKNKDYCVYVTQDEQGRCRVYTEHGPAGRLNQGKEQTTSPVSMSAAERMADEIIDKKRNQADSYQILRDDRKPIQAQPSPAPAKPVQKAPIKKVTSITTLSPASRAKLDVIF